MEKSKIKYKTIPHDAIIDIQVSGSYYRNVVALMTMLAESKPMDEFKGILEKLKDNKPAETMYEYNVHLLLTLIYEVEKQAEKQNKLKEEEIEVDERELPPST